MTLRVCTLSSGHWRRECRTGSRRYALAMLRAFFNANIDADVRRRR